MVYHKHHSLVNQCITGAHIATANQLKLRDIEAQDIEPLSPSTKDGLKPGKAMTFDAGSGLLEMYKTNDPGVKNDWGNDLRKF